MSGSEKNKIFVYVPALFFWGISVFDTNSHSILIVEKTILLVFDNDSIVNVRLLKTILLTFDTNSIVDVRLYY